MTEVMITTLPAAPLHVFEIWSNPAAVAKRHGCGAKCGRSNPCLQLGGDEAPPQGRRQQGRKFYKYIRDIFYEFFESNYFLF